MRPLGNDVESARPQQSRRECAGAGLVRNECRRNGGSFVPMGMSDREHDIIMWRDLQNQRRSRAGGQEPQSGGCLPKFLLAVVVFFVLAYAAAHLPSGANSNSCNGQDLPQRWNNVWGISNIVRPDARPVDIG